MNSRPSLNSFANHKSLTFVFQITAVISLLIYSFSQVDLNLTLSSNSTYQAFQHQLTQLGYFRRLWSTLIYIAILIALFISYFLLIHLSKNKQLHTSNTIKLLLTTVLLLLIAYPAFSFDAFNYIFDARIAVLHHQNPLTHTALNFPTDLWTRFMRWTHRPYPYGPTWLPLTIPFYLLGFGKFLPTLLSFKLLGALSYLVTSLTIYKLAHKLSGKQQAITSLVLFAFNPLIIIESLVSAHLDITMAAALILSLWFLLTNRHLSGWLSLALSAGIKYVSLAASPFLFLYQCHRLSFDSSLTLSVYATYTATVLVITQREILPWYFIVPFALTSLLPHKRHLVFLMHTLTFATLIRYAPFLYIGSYPETVIASRNFLTLVILIMGLLAFQFSPKSQQTVE